MTPRTIGREAHGNPRNTCLAGQPGGRPRMRLPSSAHTSRPWRIHELTRDFRLEDVWALPGDGGADDFPRLVQMIASRDPSQSSSRAVRAGLSAFLDACLEPSFRRIVVLDSVSVLQSKVLEVGIDPVELPMLRTVLTPLLGTTTFGGIALDALTYVALGGLYGASLYIARASDPRAARTEVDLGSGSARV